jgi:fructokinase
VPSVVGIGLVALDVVIDQGTGRQVGEWAGGSCGNVMAILAYLGWAAAPIARLDDGEPSRRIRDDLGRWGVDPRWLSLEPAAPAPVYVERLSYNGAGVAHHRFERYCPECGQRLPRHRAVPRETVRPLLGEIAHRDVLYVDRPSAGAVLAAEHARGEDVFVYFEPSARGTERQLGRIAGAADVVKYSADRLSAEDRQAIAAACPRLEIETCGRSGLRYRRHGSAWRTLPAPAVLTTDAAGAGDWMTAGLLHSLFAEQQESRADVDNPASSLAVGQALAAFSCGFVGARGAMDSHTAEEALAGAAALIEGHRYAARQRHSATTGTGAAFSCGECVYS